MGAGSPGGRQGGRVGTLPLPPPPSSSSWILRTRSRIRVLRVRSGGAGGGCGAVRRSLWVAWSVPPPPPPRRALGIGMWVVDRKKQITYKRGGALCENVGVVDGTINADDGIEGEGRGRVRRLVSRGWLCMIL
jgi:hypothetical protein